MAHHPNKHTVATLLSGCAAGRVWQALQEQILSDFKKVTGFGKKAGFIPPIKMPHV
jgi:hypothetical protein